MDFEKINTVIETQRTKGLGLARFGFADKNGDITGRYDTVCYAAAKLCKSAYFFLTWGGDPEVIKANKSDGRRNYPSEDRTSFQPGPLSDAWLEFILSPEFSPWKDILPHLVCTDPAVIRESGIIIKDPGGIKPWGLFYNFIIASRYAYEFSHRAQFWLDLVKDQGLDPRIAYLISIGYAKLDTKAKPPLRKVLKTAPGYRKNEKGRYIRDEWKEKKWFPAEFEEIDDHPNWKPSDGWNGDLKAITCCNHTPLFGMKKYCGRVLNSSIGEESSGGNYGPNAWDIFYSKNEPEYEGKEKLADVIEFLKQFQK